MKYKTINKHQQQATKRKKTAKNETKQKQNRNKMAKKKNTEEMNPKNAKKIQRGMLTPSLPPPNKIGGGRFVRSERVSQLDSAIPQKHTYSIAVDLVE